MRTFIIALLSAILLQACGAGTVKEPRKPNTSPQTLKELIERYGDDYKKVSVANDMSHYIWDVSGTRLRRGSASSAVPARSGGTTSRSIHQRPDLERWSCTLDYLIDKTGHIRSVSVSGTGCELALK